MRRALSRKNVWEAIPPGVRDRFGRFLGRVPPEHLLGSAFRRHLSFVRDAQFWSAERSRAYQLAQLQRICRLAYSTPFYRRAFDRIGFTPADLRDLDDLRALPTIDKQTLRENLDEMRTRVTGSDYVATGGSSGEPLRFYIDSSRSAIEYAHMVASWERCGFRLALPRAVLRGSVVPENRNGLRHYFDPITRAHHYSNFHLNADTARAYREHIATLGPCYLHVYPSSAARMARLLEAHGAPRPDNVLGLLAGSENIYPSDRDDIERIFHARMFSWYGHSEKLVLAAECEGSRRYHVWPTYGYCELLDDRGQPITRKGERGQIVGTGFINTVVPFVRYKTGDYATFGGDTCDVCGREHMLLEDVQGRWPEGDLLGRDGSAISLTTLNMHDDTFEGIVDYQFHQQFPGQARLHVVPVRSLNATQRARLLERLAARLQGQVELELVVCTELERTSSGKRLRVVHTTRATAN